MENYLDPTLPAEVRARDLLEKLTVEEKLMQLCGLMAIHGMEGRIKQFLHTGMGQISTLDFRNRTSYAEAAAWQRELQTIVMDSSRFRIPAVFHMEGLCGPLMQGAASFPSGIARGASFHPETEEEIGEIVSRQELSCGITQILAPVLDVSRDPRMGRYSEPYSEDATVAARFGAAYTKGIQSQQIDGRTADATAKHFLGFHASQGGIHGANVEMGDPIAEEVYAKPFQAAIRESGLRGVMPCYCSINGLPMHASKKYLTDLLREDMGFTGVAVSDYCGIENTYRVQHIGESLADAGYLCMDAGTDVDLPMPDGYAKELIERFASGQLDMSVLDRTVLRVLTAKFRMGLFEHPFALEGDALHSAYTCAHDREVSLRSARESIVLLKNTGVLPLAKTVKKIAVIGPHAANARFFFGGYTQLSMVEAVRAKGNSMAGTGGGGSTQQLEMKRIPGTNVQVDDGEEFASILPWLYPGIHSLLDELTERLPDTTFQYACGYPIFGADQSGFEEALAIAKDADLVILTLGGKNGTGTIATMGEGIDGTDINLPACQDAFIQAVKALGKPLVGVHFDGRPISSDIADAALDAILECWNPAECGAQAVVDALTGAINPSGKLPVSVAYNAGQLPVWYNHVYGSEWHQGESIGFVDYVDTPHTPRYPFGFGLSYTQFAYGDVTVSSETLAPDGSVTVCVDVTNTGSVAGTEIVQLYLRDIQACRIRPVQELAGFTRVDLQPGETKTVRFTFEATQAAFLLTHGDWLVERGELVLQIGASSADIRGEVTVQVTASAHIQGRERALWAKAEIA